MHEQPLELPTADWSAQKEAVRIFYKEMWDHANTALVAQLFHPEFTFRGSLGPHLVGHQQFIGYVGLVTTAVRSVYLGHPRTRAGGQQGLWQAPFPWIPPSRTLWRPANRKTRLVVRAPIFTFEGAYIRDLWVLGDIHGLIARLRGETSASAP
jgi:hypothetical protein